MHVIWFISVNITSEDCAIDISYESVWRVIIARKLIN